METSLFILKRLQRLSPTCIICLLRAFRCGAYKNAVAGGGFSVRKWKIPRRRRL